MVKEEKLRELKGANMDINLLSNPNITWKQDICPWNEAENTREHKRAVKDTSLCKYFRGIKKPDTVLCVYSQQKSDQKA